MGFQAAALTGGLDAWREEVGDAKALSPSSAPADPVTGRA
jgi:hypothetical protein